MELITCPLRHCLSPLAYAGVLKNNAFATILIETVYHLESTPSQEDLANIFLCASFAWAPFAWGKIIKISTTPQSAETNINGYQHTTATDRRTRLVHYGNG
jgi:hypothetical protein